MNVKELTIKLLDNNMKEDVYVRTEKGLKKVKAVIPIESDTNPRYFVQLILED